ncbi:DUF819 domain-containing protein [Aureivirga sp. CE67]|uniref:DUF819 family protein n=1 Tax=Aureivirga sp. CE67 TaxID=1788983 RepID=UPI0018CAF90B|nr:DUF819 family protein [Aureivirga sp. CE67]
MEKTSTVTPLITNNAVVFGILMLVLAFIFYTSSKKEGFWNKFYKIFPALLMAYFIPALLSTVGLVSAEHSKILYFVASRYLLPASLVLMTLSIDLKAVFNLGPKALIMFLTGTVGIILGGPVAILLVSMVNPGLVGGADTAEVWRGLATIAGSWIGGNANQTAMLEVYGYPQNLYGAMVLIDVVVANIWMAFLLMGINKSDKIDNWLKADNTAIEHLKKKVMNYSSSLTRNPSLTDYMIILGLAFGAVGFAHFGADEITVFLKDNFTAVNDKTSSFSTFGSHFFWLVSIATICGIALSFTKARTYEGAGASKLGSLFIFILVTTIGMKMDLTTIFENKGLLVIGLIWMLFHVGLLFLVAKLIRAPYFFLAVGSKANVGGAASAPVVASAFHPSLASVGVLLAVFGYVIGTVGALFSAELMRIVSP